MESPDALFLQLVLMAGYIAEAELARNIAGLNAKLPPEARRTLDDVVLYANYVLEPMDMELVATRNDFEDGANYFCVLPGGDDCEAITRMVFSKPQCAQLKDMLALMFADANLVGLDVSKLPLSSFSAKEYIVAEMLYRGFFLQLPAEYESQVRVIITPKLLATMEPYFEEHFGDKTLFRCLGCQKWVLKGRLCANPACGARLHERCYESFFSAGGHEAGRCPLCAGDL